MSPQIGILMGSKSDLPVMQETIDTLTEFGVSCEAKALSAHRAPDALLTYARSAEDRGIKVLIAGAGGAAHLPGMLAALTILPVLGVPIQSRALQGLDSLLSIVQMPRGVPVGTLAIGGSGATNAALLAIQILALNDDALRKKIKDSREARAQSATADLH